MNCEKCGCGETGRRVPLQVVDKQGNVLLTVLGNGKVFVEGALVAVSLSLANAIWNSVYVKVPIDDPELSVYGVHIQEPESPVTIAETRP